MIRRFNKDPADPFNFAEGRAAAEGGILPGFQFESDLKAELPDVAVPFCLSLRSQRVTDGELKKLAGLKNLTWLSLGYGKYSDEGLKELAGLTNLTTLDVRISNVTGAGLKHLAGLKKLEDLDLYGTKVTAAGLEELAPLRSLTTLRLGHHDGPQLAERRCLARPA